MWSLQCAIFRFTISMIEQNRLSYLAPVARMVPWTSYSMTKTRPSLNVVAMTSELGHQRVPPPHSARPTRKLLADLRDDVPRIRVK